jgi:hypothetical protein
MNKNRLIELLAISYDELAGNKDLKKEVIEFYKFIYGAKACSSCKDKFPKYYQELMNNGVDKLTEKSESNFKLRNNIGLLQINFGSGLFISQTDAPDDLCTRFLKENPKRISLFEKYPENWMDLINNVKDNDDKE